MLDQEAKRFIENFYHENNQKLVLHARRCLKREEEQEVVIQEALLVACRKPEEFMASEKPLLWMKETIRNISKHIVRERLRTEMLFQSFEELAPGREPSTLDGSRYELIAFCQEVVSKESLNFFLQIAEGSTTFKKEAERQGIGLPACYKRFERIRDTLQKALDGFHKSEGRF